ncbi:MAG: NUDIX domain-containing protein [Bacteroides sp.]|nr:NUDIX domain-containing protein [Bacteroides sp.]
MTHPLDTFRYCPRCGSDGFTVNNAKSKKCRDCKFVYYFNPCAATVAIIINEKQELLVARRAHEPARGTLDLPGGFTDPYETAEEGLKREVREETGLELSSISFLFSLPNIYPYSGFDVHTLDLFFRCQAEETSQLHPMDDVEELFFIPLSQIRPEEFGLTSMRKGIKRFLSQSNP